jgi:hypothetical protein
VDLTISWRALAGDRDGPASLGRIGPVSPSQAVPLALGAALDPHCRWRVIVTDRSGRALGVETIRRRGLSRPDRGAGVVGRVTVTVPATAVAQPASAGIRAAVLRAARRAADAAERARAADAEVPGGCAHTSATPGYRPTTRIRDYVTARDQTCRDPRCRQPAWRADLDHTLAYDQGGLTCVCNLGGRCRTHHKLKQVPGWTLTQPRPGYFSLTTPAGRTYTTSPDPYPA